MFTRESRTTEMLANAVFLRVLHFEKDEANIFIQDILKRYFNPP